jgi:hypothetical protein
LELEEMTMKNVKRLVLAKAGWYRMTADAIKTLRVRVKCRIVTLKKNKLLADGGHVERSPEEKVINKTVNEEFVDVNSDEE